MTNENKEHLIFLVSFIFSAIFIWQVDSDALFIYYPIKVVFLTWILSGIIKFIFVKYN